MEKDTLLEIKNLRKFFPVKNKSIFTEKKYIKAVDGVSLKIKKGSTLGLVGESGCGKTTLGMCILRLLEPTEGEIIFEGKNITKLKRNEIFNIYREIQIIFQDPYASMNPRMRVKDIISEPLLIHKKVKKVLEKKAELDKLLEQVGLDRATVDKFPHELSGGQRQRAVIARALALSPKLIICDEPTSLLDVSNQAQILNLLEDLKKELSLTYLFISHDLSVVKHISEYIAVMYLGKIVEIGESELIITRAKHPFTKALVSAVPLLNPEKREHYLLPEENIYDVIPVSDGCKFRAVCPNVEMICSIKEPEIKEIEKGHFAACHFL